MFWILGTNGQLFAGEPFSADDLGAVGNTLLTTAYKTDETSEQKFTDCYLRIVLPPQVLPRKLVVETPSMGLCTQLLKLGFESFSFGVLYNFRT